MAENPLSEIRKALEEGKAIIGTGRIVKNLKFGKVSKIFLSLNCPDKVKEKIQNYNKISAIKIVNLNYPNDELGALCKKPFSISAIALVKSS